MTAQKYIDEILRSHVEPHIDNQALADIPLFVQGGAKIRTARIYQDALANAAIDLILWPSKNPDTNIFWKLLFYIFSHINSMDLLPHFSDVIMSAIASRLFPQPFVEAQIKENIKAVRHWWVDICSGDDLIPSGKKPLPEAMLKQQSYMYAP